MREVHNESDGAALTAAAQAGKDEWRLKVLEFANAILHGDDEHRAWLVEAADYFVKGGKVPRPRSQAPITPDQPNIRALLSDCHRYINCGPNDTKAVLEVSARIEAALAAPETPDRAEDGWRDMSSAPTAELHSFRWLASHRRFGTCVVQWGRDPLGLLTVWPQREYTTEDRAEGYGANPQFWIWAKAYGPQFPRHVESEFVGWRPLPIFATPPAQSGEGVMTPEQRAREFIEVGFRSLGVPSLEPYIKIVSELIAGAEADATAAAQAQIASLTQALAEAREVTIEECAREAEGQAEFIGGPAFEKTCHDIAAIIRRRARAFQERSKTMGSENER